MFKFSAVVALSFLVSMPVAATPANQALLEVLILELEPAGRIQQDVQIGVYNLDEAALNQSLNTLAALDESNPPLLPNGQPPRVGIPGVGLFEGGAIVSSPRIITQENESAVIESGSFSEPTNTGEQALGPNSLSHPNGSRYRMEDGIRIAAEWRYETTAEEEAHLWLELLVVNERLAVEWEGELILRADETGVITIPRNGTLYTLVLKFIPLS